MFPTFPLKAEATVAAVASVIPTKGNTSYPHDTTVLQNRNTFSHNFTRATEVGRKIKTD